MAPKPAPHPQKPPIVAQALSERDAGTYIGRPPSYLKASRLGRCDGPPYLRMGRAVSYLVRDLDRWLESRRVK
jgi:hypothetical protein